MGSIIFPPPRGAPKAWRTSLFVDWPGLSFSSRADLSGSLPTLTLIQPLHRNAPIRMAMILICLESNGRLIGKHHCIECELLLFTALEKILEHLERGLIDGPA